MLSGSCTWTWRSCRPTTTSPTATSKCRRRGGGQGKGGEELQADYYVTNCHKQVQGGGGGE